MKCTVMILISFLWIHSASAHNFNPPEPVSSADEPPVSLSVGYYYRTADFEATGSDDTFRIKMEHVYLQSNFRLADDWEVYWRVGGAELRIDDLFAQNGNFRDGPEVFTAVGLNGLFYEMDDHHYVRFGYGPFAQAAIYYDFSDSNGLRYKYKTPWDVNAGLAGQVRFLDYPRTVLYGGPFVYYSSVRQEEGWLNERQRFEEEGVAGFFGGIKFPLFDSLSCTVEIQHRNRLSGGVSIIKTF